MTTPHPFALQPYSRHDLLALALANAGPGHDTLIEGASTPRKEQQRVSALITRFIRNQKEAGRLIEQRPYKHRAGGGARVAQFVFVPRTLDLFNQTATPSLHAPAPAAGAGAPAPRAARQRG